MQEAKNIRKHLKALDAQADLVDELRGMAKTEGGRINEFGRAFIAAAKDADVKQAFVARLLAVSPGAVCQHYNK